jgi:hypothetical protein
MGDGLIPDPAKVVYEDDDVRVSLIDPAKFMHIEDHERAEIAPVERLQWAYAQNPDLNQEVTVTLTAHQWAGVLATIRVGMALSVSPGIIRLMHDAIYDQMPINPRQHTDGNPEGEK